MGMGMGMAMGYGLWVCTKLNVIRSVRGFLLFCFVVVSMVLRRVSKNSLFVPAVNCSYSHSQITVLPFAFEKKKKNAELNSAGGVIYFILQLLLENSCGFYGWGPWNKRLVSFAETIFTAIQSFIVQG